MRDRRIITLALAGAALVSLLGLSLVRFPAGGGVDTEPAEIDPLNIEGYRKVEVKMENDTFSLLSSCRKLSMATTGEQLNSIKRGLKGQVGFRPLTHDLMVDLLQGFGMEVEAVKIDRMKSGVYFARLVVSEEGKVLSLDARPSDAVSVALRTGAPVWVKEDILNRYGRRTC